MDGGKALWCLFTWINTYLTLRVRYKCPSAKCTASKSEKHTPKKCKSLFREWCVRPRCISYHFRTSAFAPEPRHIFKVISIIRAQTYKSYNELWERVIMKMLRYETWDLLNYFGFLSKRPTIEASSLLG